jgi:hypothetical protein
MGAIASRYRVSNAGLVNTDLGNIETENKRENPGTLDELHKKTKGKLSTRLFSILITLAVRLYYIEAYNTINIVYSVRNKL